MKRIVRGTLKLFAWLTVIVAFASYSVVPAFARMPPKDSENSPRRDQTTRSKIVDLTKQHSVEPLKNLGQLKIIEFKMVSTRGEFNKRSLTAEEMKVVKGALSKAIAAESLNNLRQLQIIDLNTLSARGEFNKRSLSPEEMKALKNAVTKAAVAKGCTMLPLDHLYPQTSGESALQQLEVQLANPVPYDLENTDLKEYRRLHPKWHDWNRIKEICGSIAVDLFNGL